MTRTLLLLIWLTVNAVFSCRLDPRLHGSWKKQRRVGSHPKGDVRPPIEYDNLEISTSTITDYGECYEKIGESYLFGLKRMARPECFRCMTMVMRTPNVIQMINQMEELCHSTIEDAKKTCYDATRVTVTEGIFWFRSEARTLTPCPIEGKFDVGYSLKGSDLKCEIGKGTMAETCERASQANFKFNNCSFPAFDMSFGCLGSWTGPNNEEYVVFENLDSMEYRCGLMTRHKDHLVMIGFSVDSSCNSLSPTVQPPEMYTFRPVIRNKLFAPCVFPEYLLGEYNSLSISSDLLEYSQTIGDSVPIVSRCVSLNGERIMVYSETKCGDKLGFHCLWFRPRSPSVIEFKTTIPQDRHNASICADEALFQDYPWTTASVKGPSPAPCGIQGKFSTPHDLRMADCYNLTVDCKQTSRLLLTAFHCSTGIVFDSRSYDCLAAWREGGQLYTYTQRRVQHKTKTCFISQRAASRLYISATGEFCPRDFNFTDNLDRTIVLEEENDCSQPRSPVPPPTRPSVPPTPLFFPSPPSLPSPPSVSLPTLNSPPSLIPSSLSTLAPRSRLPTVYNKFPTFPLTTTRIWKLTTTTVPSTTVAERTTPLMGTHWKWTGNEVESDPKDTVPESSSSSLPLTTVLLILILRSFH